jgi:hypothetical protein
MNTIQKVPVDICDLLSLKKREWNKNTIWEVLLEYLTNEETNFLEDVRKFFEYKGIPFEIGNLK